MCEVSVDRAWVRLLAALCIVVAAGGPLRAVVEPVRSSTVADKVYRHPDLRFRALPRKPSQLPAEESARARQDLGTLGLLADSSRVDLRGGRWTTLLPAEPLLPGSGLGNTLSWESQGLAPPADETTLERAAWGALLGFLGPRAVALRIDPGELSPHRTVMAPAGGELIQIHAPRQISGVPVRGAYLTAVIRHGNLVLFGTHNWGEVSVSTRPTVSLEDAVAAAVGYLSPLEMIDYWAKPELVLLPMAADQDPRRIAPGRGYVHRLAWALRPRFEGEPGRWEVLVDAHDGEVLAFEDTNRYATAREVGGGVYPISNDGAVPDGIEQPGWPMPYDIVSTTDRSLATDGGGNVPICVDGDVTSSLTGRFVRMRDLCGAIELTSAGSLDFGTGAGTDCATPGFGGAGNTHSSRTGFHELNRVKEQARGQLPGNGWLREQLVSNVNISNSCQAFWDGSTVNFFCTAAGCANTGELAGVIHHEFGHGLDDNDATPTGSSPGEGIADVYAYLRTDDSCIGRGFRLGSPCPGYGDACAVCDGVRDIDFANRASGLPHDLAWIETNCGSEGVGPCLGYVHCEGAVTSEAVFDLINRDLPALFGMDHNTALEVGTRLTYLGAGAVGDWFTCDTVAPFFGGCNADGGYLNFLAADDDNGDLGDGTPHMSAVFAAFDRHGIACDTPAVVDAGCAGTPAAAPVVVGTALDRAVALSWGAVAGATEYQIFRADGVFGCDSGKIKVGETAGTSFTDSGLRNGRDYSYVVIPIGAGDACIGPASACTTVTPAPGPNLAIDTGSGALSILSVVDGDPFLDNCELASFSFDVSNIGAGSLTNVRIVDVVFPSHPATTFVTAFPAAVSPSTLAECDLGTASFTFSGNGMAFGDTLELEVEVSADELPASRTASFSVELVESDFSTFASRTFGFETDLEGWTLIDGTFDRTSAGGGAQGSSFYLASSAALADQCDVSRSPLLRLSATSTLEVYTEYDIEDLCVFPLCLIPTWFDRANVGIRELATGTRTPVAPDGGRPYNASGPYGTCGTGGQSGWAGTEITWGSSTWSATALGSASLAGEPVQLEVRYGTDPSISGQGLHFDQVTLTDFDLRVADTQSDICTPQCAVDAECDDTLFCNGTESCLAGSCIVGSPVDCSDGVDCTVDSCIESTDSCDNTPSDALCDNAVFCDGAETCDPLLDCQPGTDPCPGQSCDEAGDFCFTPFLLTVDRSGAGSGTVTSSPGGIDCGADCSELYPESTMVNLTAEADLDSGFAGWSGDPDCTDGTVAMTADTDCLAMFDCTSAGELVDETISGTRVVRNCNRITGGPNLIVEPGADVTFDAPLVVLQNGARMSPDLVVRNP